MSNDVIAQPVRKMNVWEKNLLGRPLGELHLILPGVVAAIVLAWLGNWMSNFIGVNLMGFQKTPVSGVMMAILLGLIVGNLFPLPVWIKPGVAFAGTRILRLGIILLGIGLSVFDLFKLGALGIPIVVVCILGALFVTTRLNDWLKLPPRLGTLIAVGTSICGATAIAATGPAIDAEDEEVAYGIAVITVFGITAMLVYPYLADVLFAANPVEAGLFLGTAIHESSHVTGAGLLFSEFLMLPSGLDVATVAKLVRNVLMAVVIPVMSIYYARKTDSQAGAATKKTSFTKLFPLFILGFLALAIARSIGDAWVISSGQAFGIWDNAAWQNIVNTLKTWAPNFLTVALAGIGLSTNFHSIKGLGLKPFYVGLGASAAVGIVSFAAISILGLFGAF